MAELAAGPDATYDRVALAVGTTSDLAQVLPSVASLRAELERQFLHELLWTLA